MSGWNPGEAADWGSEFRAFTSFHAAAAGACVAVIAMVTVVGVLRGRREARFRVCCGWTVLCFKLVETAIDLQPGRFKPGESLPIQVCDLAALTAAGAMITQRRALRVLLYFWGLGLSTQALITPTLSAGWRAVDFWFFWIGHCMILAAAAYDLIVKRFRPTGRDLFMALIWSVGYVAAITGVNLLWGLNYGFIGDVSPPSPAFLEKLGPWPLRAFKMVGAALALMVGMWVPWMISSKLNRGARELREQTPRDRIT